MAEEDKKPPLAQLETDPKGFMERMQHDRVWLNTMAMEEELREKLGFPPSPDPSDFPDYASWKKAHSADFECFMQASGIRERKKQITGLYWCGRFNAGQLYWVNEYLAGRDDTYVPGVSTDLLDISQEMNFVYGKCTLEDVVAEYQRRMAH